MNISSYPEKIKWWTDARFGLFIHWGPVALAGTEIGWSRKGRRRGIMWEYPEEGVPAEQYDLLYRQFNPVHFDADEWVATAKSAGMKYLVFTTKHHDGFCMFDSKLTDYKITHPDSPYGRDIVAQVVEACHRADFPVGLYYSQPDWHHPDYRTEHHRRYIDYMLGQLEELSTNYGKIDLFWFDGLDGTAEDWAAEEVFDLLQKHNPNVLINNRCGLPGDFETPEQEIGSGQGDRPWESCITICEQWSWKAQDTMKSLEECLRTLLKCAKGNGNLLFNVGPMPDGRIEPSQTRRLRDMGTWLTRYGESVYETRGGPFSNGILSPMASTVKDGCLYLHFWGWQGSRVTLPLPREFQQVTSAENLFAPNLDWRVENGTLHLNVPEADRDPLCTVIKLTYTPQEDQA